MERVAGREPRDGTRNAVTLGVLFELEDAASLHREPCGERRARAKERGHQIRKTRRLLEIAALQDLEHPVEAFVRIVRLQVLIPKQLGADLRLGLDDQRDDTGRKLVALRR